jgi:hypothetical protein
LDFRYAMHTGGVSSHFLAFLAMEAWTDDERRQDEGEMARNVLFFLAILEGC